ncbi:hypothetical protein [Dawidia soli]|uniref:Uncharacterized protein n=1 Tax=Dawidia soli TaxID=2782352 RepID=A0AAP2D944_9BACT|nr:hypothetical protein [Dawidia soli]MBT1687594.1 hypothetical protein [Dawidia soli]
MKWIFCVCITVLTLLGVQTAHSQKVMLDEPIKAGPLTVFPDVADKNSYYYVTDKPRIATAANGKPKFSFLKYVDNNAANKEGDGGGLVHAVVVLEVTEEHRRLAERELQRIKPGAVLKGPILFTDGTIALISSIANKDGEFTKQVLGVGKAPILDGHQAAISVLLNKQGAKILWESFKTPTPDMSVSFEMTMQGYRSPKRVKIEANFDQMYEASTFQAAASMTGPVLLAGEINATFEDLRKSGAIKVEQYGEDEDLEKALETAYNKLTSMMFDPAGGTGSPSLSQLGASTGVGGASLLDRATTRLNEERNSARTQNAAVRAENRANADRRNSASSSTGNTGNGTTTTTGGTTSTTSTGSTTTASTTGSTTTGGTDASLRDDVRIGPRRAMDVSQGYTGSSAVSQPADIPEVDVPSISIMASYQMKKIHQSGNFSIDLNKYTVDNLVLRFDENFGQIKCTDCFREANLEDPLYVQRDVFAYLDGFNSEDFGKYINFANVTIRKKHEGGDVTNQEIRIDKTNFNTTGNTFKVIYGWKNDADRLKWLDYDYKVVWNYFGGFTEESPWVTSSMGSVPVSSPYVRKMVDIEADPAVFEEKGVRSAEVKVTYTLGGKEQVRNFRLDPKKTLSGQIDLLMPAQALAYEYEINWILKTGKTVSSGKLPGTSSLIFADNL